MPASDPRVPLASAAIVSMPMPSPLAAGAHEVVRAGQTAALVYVPRGGAGTGYVEHWVLFPGYSIGLAANAVFVPLAQAFEDAADFLSRATFPAGSSYLRLVGT